MARVLGDRDERRVARMRDDGLRHQLAQLLRCDGNVVEMEEAGLLQEAELHFGGVAGCYHVVAELRIRESWQAGIVSDHRSSPAHLEAVWRSRGKVGEPIANLVARARNGGEVLRNESEIRDRTDKKSPDPAVNPELSG